jgi:hypothetical protein
MTGNPRHIVIAGKFFSKDEYFFFAPVVDQALED